MASTRPEILVVASPTSAVSPAAALVAAIQARIVDRAPGARGARSGSSLRAAQPALHEHVDDVGVAVEPLRVQPVGELVLPVGAGERILVRRGRRRRDLVGQLAEGLPRARVELELDEREGGAPQLGQRRPELRGGAAGRGGGVVELVGETGRHRAERDQAHLLLRVGPERLIALRDRPHELAQDAGAAADHLPEGRRGQPVDAAVGQRHARDGHGDVDHERLVAPEAARLEGDHVHPLPRGLVDELDPPLEQQVEPQRRLALLHEVLAARQAHLLADQHVRPEGLVGELREQRHPPHLGFEIAHGRDSTARRREGRRFQDRPAASPPGRAASATAMAPSTRAAAPSSARR
jgi:hypothetical protein